MYKIYIKMYKLQFTNTSKVDFKTKSSIRENQEYYTFIKLYRKVPNI